jgi:Chemotaxis response regulator containing a CheY-like receiver domain and a methylesterase domain
LVPGTRKRVLLADDAVVARKLLSQAIEGDAELEVAATAANGCIALNKFAACKPDIVLLDMEMPEMDGLETVRELRKIDAHVPIIMFSSLTQSGASLTLEALALGATDYVSKPSNMDVASTLQAITRDLIPRIRALCHLPVAPPNPPAERKPLALPQVRLSLHVQIVVIGVSTGGPDALARLLPTLPARLPVPVLIVQHMPAVFTPMLAARLNSKCALPVEECVSGVPVALSRAVIAPGDFHMVVQKEDGRARLRTHQGPRENSCRPSVDVLFRSVAAVYGGRALAIVLTGMGQDGLQGCEILRAQGSRVYVQDEASSVVWGMPGAVAEAGLADKILPLDRIGEEIVRVTVLERAAQPFA